MNLATPTDRFRRTLPLRWAAIDFETTGIWSRDPSTGVIEAAAVIYEGAREVSAWSTLVYPETAISDFIINLTKITPEMIDAAGVDRGSRSQSSQSQSPPSAKGACVGIDLPVWRGS